MRFFTKMLGAFVLFVIVNKHCLAQVPSNDSCHNASIISIGSNGFGIGTFQSDSIAIDSANIQVGEYFHTSLVSSGNDKKSIWFKFFLPSRRAVNIELKQNANSIATKDCGFTTFYGDGCLPNSVRATQAKLTPLNQFGSSFNACMDDGWYLVQVSSKSRSQGKIFLEVTTSYPHEYNTVVDAEYDVQDSAYDFGNKVVGRGGSHSAYVNFELGCYTLSDSSEYVKDIGSNYRDYTQSAWFVFNTLQNADATRFQIYPTSNCNAADTFGYRLYKGDCRENGQLQLLDSAVHDWRSGSACSGNCSAVTKQYKCLFDSGQYYSIQLVFKKNEDKTFRLAIDDQTALYDSTFHKPISGVIKDLGVLKQNKSINFGFSCESYQPQSGCNSKGTKPIVIGGYTYNLGNWYQFELQNLSKINITLQGGSNSKNYQQIAFRLFRDTSTTSCNDLDSTSIIRTYKGRTTQTFECLDPGKYILHVMGTDTILSKCAQSYHLGGDYRVAIGYSYRSSSVFGLINKGEADSVNGLDALPNRQLISAGIDTVSCKNTIDLENNCANGYHKKMFRVFTIGDADSNGTKDSGVLWVDNLFGNYSYANNYHRIYSGNALSLRQNQNITSYPDTLKGLSVYDNCTNGRYTPYRGTCIEPGIYTLVSSFSSNHEGRTEKPRFKFTKDNTKFDKYHNAEFLDSFLTYRNSFVGQFDSFSCRTNKDTIDQVVLGDKNTYHVFYVGKEMVSRIGINYNANRYGGRDFSLFKGDIRQGKAGLKLVKNGQNWERRRFSYWQQPNQTTLNCYPLDTGWHTIVVSINKNVGYDSLTRNFNDNNWLHYHHRIELGFYPIRHMIGSFNLNDSNRVDSIKNLEPLNRFKTIWTERDTVPCENSVLPGLSCDSNSTKAIFRTFHVGDTNTGSPFKDGLIVFTDLNNGYNGIDRKYHHSFHKVYKGNLQVPRNSQGLNAFPDTIAGVQPITDCINRVSSLSLCLDSGEYTLVSMFDTTMSGVIDRPRVSYYSSQTKFTNYASAEVLDSIVRGSYYGQYDTFSCHTNPDTIDGVSCGIRNTYHVFYLDSISKLNIGINNWSAGYYNTCQFSVFKGDIRNGKASLKVVDKNGAWSCISRNRTSAECYPFTPGWYTVVVSNNYKIDFDSSVYYSGDYNRLYTSPHRIEIHSYQTSIKLRKYERLALACNIDSLINNGQPITYDTNYSDSIRIPINLKQYVFPKEYFECSLDTPINYFPNSRLCDTSFTDVAFYHFNLKNSAYMRLRGNWNGGSWKVQLYKLNPYTDSALFASVTPIQDCNYNANYVEFCNLQPGPYTVVYFLKRNKDESVVLSPIMFLDSVIHSRFDHAKNAYDFGIIRGDGQSMAGKSGDTHPLDAQLPPSLDYISCTTGAQLTDPTYSNCYNHVNPIVYSGDTSIALYPYDSSVLHYSSTGNAYSPWSYPIRRNIWYSFVIDKKGRVTVKLNRLRSKLLPHQDYLTRFSVYESDVDGTINFTKLVTTGQVDSSINSGLTYKYRSSSNHCYYGGGSTVTFDIPECDSSKSRRYYVLVDLNGARLSRHYYSNEPYPHASNLPVWLEVQFDSLREYPAATNDLYSKAKTISPTNTNNLLRDGGLNSGAGWVRGSGSMSVSGARSGITPIEGSRYIWANSYYYYRDSVEFYQQVTLNADQLSAVAVGNVTFSLAGYFQNLKETISDLGKVVIEFRSNNDSLLMSETTGWDSSVGIWKSTSLNGTCPKQTTKIIVRLRSLYRSDNYYHDVFFDDFSLTISIPDSTKSQFYFTSNSLYQGDRVYMKGSTLDSTDYKRTSGSYSCSNRNIAGTVWYKFEVDSTGYIYYNFLYGRKTGESYHYYPWYIALYRETIPGDSINGLAYVTPSTSSQFSSIIKSTANYACVSPGTYYIQINACDLLQCYDYVIPQIAFDFHDGDFCESAIPIRLDTIGSATRSALVNCHTIGTDFGEDGTDMGCLFGPKDFKSTWFKVDYTDTAKVDLEFKLSEYTNAKAKDIRYRTYYGNCKSLTSGPCNNNALTSFVLDCVRKGTYYVQIVTPSNSTGTLDITATAKENKDTTCKPVDIFQPNAAFTYNTGCPENVVEFVNTSSRGDSIKYLWTLDYNNQTDSSINPIFAYPPKQVESKYSVKLLVTNISTGSRDSVEIDVDVPFSPYTNISNHDTSICAGDSVKLNSYISHGNGIWSTFDTASSIFVRRTGTYYFDLVEQPQLVKNGSFERSLSKSWTAITGTWTTSNNQNYLPQDSSYVGFAYNSTPGLLEAYQWVDISFDSIDIDSGRAKTSFVSSIRGYGSYGDEGQVQLEYYSSSNVLLAIYRSGFINSPSGWEKLVHSRTTPKGTRRLKITLQSNKLSTNNSNSYVFFDKLIVKQRSACSYADSVYVQVNQIPKVELPRDTFFCLHDSFNLKSITSYLDPYIVQDSMQFSTSGKPVGSTKHIPTLGYTLLTNDQSPSGNGQIEWEDSTLSMRDSFIISFDYYSSGKNHYALWFYMFAARTPSSEDFASGGYSIAFDGYDGNSIQIEWNNSRLKTNYLGIDLDNGKWHNVQIMYMKGRFQIYIDGKLFATYFDGTSRTQVGSKFGFGARSGYNNEYRIRNFHISRKNPQLVVVPSSTTGMTFRWNDSHTDSNRWVHNTSTFTLQVTDLNGCKSNIDTVTIREVKQYDSLITGLPNVCNELDTFRFSKPVQSGWFYGNIAVDSTGLVTTQLATIGQNEVRFGVIDTFGCLNLDTATFVLDTVPTIVIDSIGPVCRNDENVQLTVNDTNGYFFGGIYVDSSGLFIPDSATSRINRVYYRTAGAYCIGIDSIDIIVDSIPDAAITAAGPFCANAGIQTLTAAVNAGGLFTSTTYLDTAGQFDPATAQSGSHTVYYSFTDSNGCSNIDSTTIVVDTIPNAAITAAGPFCANAGIQNLTATVNSGGLFTATTYIDTAGQFDPALAQVGNRTVYYSFTDNNGCSNTDSATVVVDSIPSAVFSTASPYCVNEGLDTLKPLGNASGFFTGLSSLDSNGVFNPSQAGVGQYRAFYMVTDGNGCSGSDSNVLVVDSLTQVTLASASPFCLDDTLEQVIASPTIGGYFTGGASIDSQGYFNPSTAGAGAYTMYFTQTNGLGCKTLDSLSIFVDTLPNASIQSVGSLCANDDSVQVQPVVNGGHFEGAFIDSVGYFKPQLAGAGRHTIYYRIKNSSDCWNLDSTTIVVDSIPDAAIRPAGPFCANAGIQSLVGVNIGGRFTPTTYLDTTGQFNPASAQSGSHKVFHQITDGNGCSSKDSLVVVVDSIPDAAITAAGPFCANDSVQSLTASVNAGGLFTATAYLDTAGQFDPAVAQAGSHKAYYSFTDNNGCSNTDSTNIVVDTIPSAAITAAGPFCANAGLQSLTAAVNSGGLFTATTYLDTTGQFDPTLAQAGSHMVYYSFIDNNGCANTDSTTIVVDSIPSAAIAVAGPFCLNQSAVNLAARHNAGGRFTSTAYLDIAGQFIPLTAGTGSHTIYYSFTDGNGCSNTDSTVIVVDTLPDASITDPGSICKNAGVVTLTPSISNGRFAPTVYLDTLGNFDPWLADTGWHMVYYTLGDNSGCINTDSLLVRVDSIPDAAITAAGSFCANAGIQNLTPAVNAGGRFVQTTYLDTTGQFDPAAAQAGNHTVFYSFTDNKGCSNTDSTTIVVDSIPSATIAPFGPFCLNAGIQQVIPTINSGGVFTATTYLTTAGVFDPVLAGAGIHQAVYSFTDQNGCTGMDSIQVTVHALPDAGITSVGALCLNASAVQLAVNTSGGVFSGGSYVTSSGLFTPSAGTSGINRVVYSITDANNCNASDSIDITVLELPTNTLSIQPDEGCEPLRVTISTQQNGNEDSVIWNYNNQTVLNQFLINDVFNAGTYAVALEVVHTNGCRVQMNSSLKVHPKPTANFNYTPDKIYLSQPQVFFQDQSFGNVIGWSWDLGDGASDNRRHPEHTYTAGGEYTVQLFVENDKGCIDTTERLVVVLDELMVFIPNAISPDQNDLNDVFRVTGIGYENISIEIFNRWGEQIYKSSNFKEWDGTYQGKKVQQGRYIYVMTILDNRGRKHFKNGEILVIR